ncbi:MAG: amidohydrolase [Gammaproteobacteria bacterium]|nr:amidohydrolase [Gammaproteobacteria bacterium]
MSLASFRRRAIASAASFICVSLFATAAAAQSEAITVFTAKSVITMDDSLPRADAVAVSDGRIVAVGTLDSMRPWLEARPHSVDDVFADKYMLPGLIDNHLHPPLAGLLLNTHWITPHEWNLPGWKVEHVRGHDRYLSVLRAAVRASDRSKPFITWGFHEIWHGQVGRQELDDIAPEQPLIVWQRSFHEVITNTPGLRWLGVDPDAPSPHHEVDLQRGSFSEQGLVQFAAKPLAAYLLAPDRLASAYARLVEIVHRGGITTIADMGAGGYFGFEKEVLLQKNVFGNDRVPFRVVIVPAVIHPAVDSSPAEIALSFENYLQHSTDKVRIDRHVKLLADGAFFAQYMRMNAPGYTDGHEGKWLTEPADLELLARAFWQKGYQIHVHVNGDEGLDVVLDILDTLVDETPRRDHRFTLHHVGYSTNDQLRRAATLGAAVSAQPYYLWALADAYADTGLGYDRASQMSRIGGMIRSGMAVSLHSDFTMAPAAPLTLAWVAVNRVTANGTLMAPAERISVYDSLRAVTIDAAFALRMEHEIGSIVAGKRADFTILEADPLEVDPMELKDVAIWGTVYEGRIFPVTAAD